ncbi:DUF6934 family protein [Niabella hirudinis]|uniref:DUF6934 family protein n=1 Tax=Niabella hirudinis TaxID=1285929 RepID=UPI003EBA29BF
MKYSEKGQRRHLCFGDLLPNGSIDGSVHSDNGDIIKVLVTVICILKEFTLLRPNIKIMFVGSTPERQRLYQRILKMYHSGFIKEFAITGLIETDQGYKELIFKPESHFIYLAFLCKEFIKFEI